MTDDDGALACRRMPGFSTFRAVSASLWALFGLACVIEAPSDRGDRPCNGRPCSEHGTCEGESDRCVCDAGYVGNPYAAHGCQPTQPSGQCDTTCGLNAWCDGSTCRCADGFVAVCGTGDCIAEASLCDGVEDCSNAADEQPDVCFETVVMQWWVTDDCDDGAPIEWRVWATEREWVWPGPEDAFVTRGLGERGSEAIECLIGETVCFGGSAGDTHWGVGVAGSVQCDACCEPCAAVSIDYGALTCQ